MGLTQISTPGIKDDAITKAKIPANQIEASEIANGAVGSAEIASGSIVNSNINNNAGIVGSKLADSSISSAKIADQAVTLDKLPHGTSSNDGKFLRANNGADPSFETVSIPAGTTINNNADNRIITGSASANTLNGESGLTYDGSNLSVTGGLDVSSDVKLHSNITVDNMAVQAGGTKNPTVGIPKDQLGVKDDQAYDVTDNGGAIAFSAKYHANGSFTTMGSIEGVKNNNSSGDYGGNLVFRTRLNGSSNSIGMRLTNNGLCFGTDNADVNALDAYEEGTWSPTINVGSYTTFLSHKYIKIGKLVHLHGGFLFNNNTSSTRVEISNIPFSATSSQYVGNVWLRRTSTGNKNYNMILGEAGSNKLSVHHDSDGGHNDMGGHLSYSNFGSSATYFNYSITYIAAS